MTNSKANLKIITVKNFFVTYNSEQKIHETNANMGFNTGLV